MPSCGISGVTDSVLFYTGFGGFFKSKDTPHPSIDQGGIATSEDLKHWRFVQHPILRHRYNEQSGCDPLRDDCQPNVAQFWDGAFVRPRSLNKVGDWWYCWYEGAMSYPRHGTESGADAEHITGCDAITDSIGIARARNQRLRVAHRFQFQRLASKNKCVAR